MVNGFSPAILERILWQEIKPRVFMDLSLDKENIGAAESRAGAQVFIEALSIRTEHFEYLAKQHEIVTWVLYAMNDPVFMVHDRAMKACEYLI